MSDAAEDHARLLPSGLPRILFVLFAALLGGIFGLERFGVASAPLLVAAVAGAVVLFALVGLLAHTIRVPDHYVGGRCVSAALGGAAAAAGGLLGAALIGLSGTFYGFAADGLRTFAGMALAICVVFGALGPTLRRLGASSVPDFLAARFGGNPMRLLSAAILGLSAFAILVALLDGATDFAADAFGLAPSATAAGLAVLVALACIPGGALSVIATQVAQYSVWLGGYLVALLLLAFAPARAPLPAPAVETGAGFGAALAAALESLVRPFDPAAWPHEAAIVVALGLGLAMSPFLLPKALSATAPRRVPAMGGYALLFLLLPVIALPALVLAADLAGMGLEPDGVAPTLSRLRSLPVAVTGLALASVLAGFLAAASPALMAAAGAVSHDLLDRILMTQTPESRRLFLARILIAVIGYAAYRTAVAVNADPLAIVGIALAASATLLPPLLLGIWWRRANAVGAYMGIVAGLAVTGWSLAAMTLHLRAPGFLVWPDEGLSVVVAAVLGVPLGLAATVAFSLMSDEPKPATQDFIDEIGRPRRDILFKERPA